MNLLRSCGLFLSFKRNQWKSSDELEGIQERKLKGLLAHAKATVPHYRKALRGIGGSGLGSLDLLPVLRKADIQKHPSSFISDRYEEDSLARLLTSGSGGTPLASYFDQQENIYARTLGHHQLTECGFGPADLMAAVLAVRYPPHHLERLVYRSYSLLIGEGEDKALSSVMRRRPDILYSFASVLLVMARQNASSGNPLAVRHVFSSSEMLDPSARDYIIRSFSCRLRNLYGSNETRGIAWECERGSMHINSDSVIVEVVDDGGHPVPDGSVGNILLTPLWRYSMPFIRYWIGDRGSLGRKCPCGRGLHVLKSLEGRSNDLIALEGGRFLSPMHLAVGLKKFPEILRYQVYQEEPGSITLRILPSGKIDKEAMIRSINASLPERMDISIELVDGFPREPGGKIRFIVSKVKPG
ncbi:MAG: hypothetical protein U0R44_04955 [Candidatus Micrarchaeia archaeon]